ncbi:MAG: hypothetical protein SFU53_13270 [Terrimicrobiaceae bacterium]|nr:hypothetical protein [Terrimicrobiaceae bacterium]
MRSILVAIILSSVSVFAGQLDLAVIQFPEVKTAEELDAALANVNLAEITNSDRTMTTESYLKGGYVVFAQSLPATAGQRFASATRLKNARADVTGRLGSSEIAVSITISEGVDAGLRRFSQRVYEAQAALSSGPARVLSIRQVSGRTQGTVKGQATVKDVNFCSVIIGQYTP